MATVRIAFLGDVVGDPGRKAFAHAAQSLRASPGVDVIIVNGENSRNGSGITPDNYKELRRAGADAITLGDHCFKDSRISDYLDDGDKPIARPANLSPRARGKTSIRIDAHESRPAIHIITVLGRLYMPLPADDPFATVDREVERIVTQDPAALVIVEVHSETTSEKIAMAWHCLENWRQRVVGVVGTHTHVQTADARILEGCLGAITDLGMCGGARGVIGREVEPVLSFMTRQTPAAFAVAGKELAATGVLLSVDPAERKCIAIEPVRVRTPEDDAEPTS